MTWIKSSDRLPEYNVGVLVFIPEEDNHITAGMWDISKKWVLLDEYRVPKSEVTYWCEMPSEPEDKSHTPFHEPTDEMDTVTGQIRALQKKLFETEQSWFCFYEWYREANAATREDVLNELKRRLEIE